MTHAVTYRGISNHKNQSQLLTITRRDLVYNRGMLESVFQILAVYLFAATPCFAGWIANGGKREDVGIPIFASILLSLVFGVLIYFFT